MAIIVIISTKFLFLINILSMQKLHHFLIHDNDSETNFALSQLPVKFACGYSFCDYDGGSTKSQSSNNSDKVIHNKNEYSKTKDDLDSNFKKGSSKNYHESAIRKHLSNIESAYAQHKIDVASAEVLKLKKLCEKSSHSLSSDERKQLSQVEKQMKDVEYYESILQQNGWQLKVEKKNIKVSSKVQGNTVGVLVEAFLDAPIENFLATITEIQLMKNWMPFMQSSSLEKIVARNCRIGHCINNFPILAKRQSFFQGIGYDRMEHNSTVFMFTRSLNERKDLQKQLQYTVVETENAVQLDYRYFILEYKPDNPESGTLKMAINVDMKLNIPMFILNPATTGFGIDFYKNVLQIAKNFKGSEWEQKMRTNPAFFNFVQKRISQYFHSSR